MIVDQSRDIAFVHTRDMTFVSTGNAYMKTTMLSKPFRPPLLKRSLTDENDQHLPKKLKSEAGTSGHQRLVFKSPGISTLPRKPLQEVSKPASKADDETSGSSYNVLWRKLTGKKNKTWEGDALLVIDPDGMAELYDRETGRSIGRAKCCQPLLPGSTIVIAGKDIEVDSVLSKAQFADLKHSLAAKKPKPLPTAEYRKVLGDQLLPTEKNEPQEKPKVFTKLPNESKKLATVPHVTATAKKGQNAPNPDIAKVSQHGQVAVLPLHTPQPRHSQHAPNALVMKRTPNAIVDVVVDPLLSGRLRKHQREGVMFLYECVMGLRGNGGHGAILADEMGLGKTLQTIALIWTLLKQNPSGTGTVIKKVIIACPATLINNWRKEFRKWLGLDRIGVLVADGKSRVRDFTHGKSYSIMIVGYEKLRNIQAELSKGQTVDLIVADEAHRLKTAKNKSAQAIKAFPTERRIFLTGTPVQNDLSEFHVLVDTVNPGTLGSIKAFTRDFEVPISRSRQPGASSKEIEEGEERNKELMNLAFPFILRRTADILANYLPTKTEHVLFCRPTKAQTLLYRHLTTSPTFRAAALGKSECSLQLITILKKACNSPSLLSSTVNHEDQSNRSSDTAALLSAVPPQLVSNNAASTKLRMLDTLLHTLRTTTNEKIVLVSNYTSTLDLLGQLLTSVGCKFSRMDGSTPSSKRQGIIDDFNRSSAEDCFAFLLSAKTGGVGINLVGASRLVLFDVDWNPATDLQAMARIYRDGQRRNCFIYRFLMAGGIDEKIWQRQIVKLGLAGSIIDQKEESSSFTREDLKDLFRLDESVECQTHELIGCGCGDHGTDFKDIDDYVDPETLPGIPALLEANGVDGKQQAEKSKAVTHAARDALMAYSHFDTSKLADGGNEDVEVLIKDNVLLQMLKDEGSTVSYVFSKSSE